MWLLKTLGGRACLAHCQVNLTLVDLPSTRALLKHFTPANIQILLQGRMPKQLQRDRRWDTSEPVLRHFFSPGLTSGSLLIWRGHALPRDCSPWALHLLSHALNHRTPDTAASSHRRHVQLIPSCYSSARHPPWRFVRAAELYTDKGRLRCPIWLREEAFSWGHSLFTTNNHQTDGMHGLYKSYHVRYLTENPVHGLSTCPSPLTAG